MKYPIDACITPPKPELPELTRADKPYAHIITRMCEPELEIRFHDGSRATFVGPIVNDMIRRIPQRNERMSSHQVWYPIMYPPQSHMFLPE